MLQQWWHLLERFERYEPTTLPSGYDGDEKETTMPDGFSSHVTAYMTCGCVVFPQ